MLFLNIYYEMSFISVLLYHGHNEMRAVDVFDGVEKNKMIIIIILIDVRHLMG